MQAPLLAPTLAALACAAVWAGGSLGAEPQAAPKQDGWQPAVNVAGLQQERAALERLKASALHDGDLEGARYVGTKMASLDAMLVAFGAPPPAPAPVPAGLAPGQAYVLQNLTEHFAHNGHVARVLEQLETGKVRVAVHGAFLAPHGQGRLRVRPEHLRPLYNRTQVTRRPVVTASSSRGDFPTEAVLDPNEQRWWISAPGSMPKGEGKEWLAFDFGTPTYVSLVALSIPPLPHGPLSVRKFAVEAWEPGDTWVRVTPVLSTLDLSGLQEVAVEHASRKFRLTCFSTASPRVDSVGLFRVAFV